MILQAFTFFSYNSEPFVRLFARLHCHRPRDRAAIAKVFAEIRQQKFDFVHVLDVSARLGSRELRAVKIPASYDAWRPPIRRKIDLEKLDFWASQKSVFRNFFRIFEVLDNLRYQNQFPREIMLEIHLF